MSRNAPQLTNTISTGNAIAVPSTAGFAAGELIYYKNGDYGSIPGNAVSSAPFNLNALSSTIVAGTGGPTTQLSFEQGSTNAKQVAKLTNGNVVRVYYKIYSPYQPCFTITDPTGATVVAETIISSTYTSGAVTAQIGVVALSGGGFATYWLNGAGGTAYLPCYAIYSNTGSVVTAATQDSTLGVGNTSYSISGTELPNGGFVIAYVLNGNSTPYFRAYSSTGVGVFAWTSGGTAQYSPSSLLISISARSDNSTLMVWQSSSTVFTYFLANSAGGTVVNATFSPTVANNGNTRAIDVSTLADGTTFVIGYNVNSGTSTYACFRFLPTGNTLGSEFYVPPANVDLIWPSTTISSTAYAVRIFGLSSGGFMYLFTDTTGVWSYAFFNSSGVPTSGISGSVGTGALTKPLPYTSGYLHNTISPVEVSGNVMLYWATGRSGAQAYDARMVKISLTTFDTVPVTYVSQTATTATSSVSGYARSASTPTGASFLASTTTVLSAVKTYGYTIAPSSVYSAQCDAISVANFADGGFVYAYRDLTTYTVYFKVYSADGAVLQTVTVGTGYASASSYNVKVTVLSGGSIVVAYCSASSVCTINVYTGSAGSYALTGSTTVPETVVTPDDSSQFGLAGITNNRFVIAYSGPSNYPKFIVYSSTLSILAGPTIVYSPITSYNVNVCATPGGGFFVTFLYSGAYRIAVGYSNPSGDTFSATTNGVNKGADYNFQGAQGVAFPNGWFASLGNSGNTSSPNVYMFDVVGNSNGSLSYSTSDLRGSFQIGMTGAGSLAVINLNVSGGVYYMYAQNLGCPSVQNATMRSTLSGVSVYTPGGSGGGQVCTAPGIGYNIIVAYINAARIPSFFVYNAYPYTYTTPLTSGVTGSATLAVSPSSTGTLNNCVFQGVSLTAASAGGSGLVQTNGLAALNTNYSASTAASGFDYTSPNGSGVTGTKGTISGRNVNLQGNS